MQSADSSRYINSVSDLYGDDEIEFLLDDIRELEPISCLPEDLQVGDGMSGCVLQDLEIAGSSSGGGGGGGGAGGDLGAEGGAEVEGCGELLESPIGTVHSWDSHSHYRQRSGSPDSIYSGVIVYCDHAHFKTPTGLMRLLLLITTVACLTCLCTSGTVKVGLFMLPLVGRIRLMMFASLMGVLITCLLLFLDISHMIYLFPFPWGKVNAYIYLGLSVLFLIASTLIFHTIFLSEAFSWVPKWTHQQLLVTGCLGYACCAESLVLTIIQKCSKDQYEPVVAEDPSSMNLQERRHSSASTSHQHNQSSAAHNYKPIVNYQQVTTTMAAAVMAPPSSSSAAAAASTSKHNYLLDDVQPCSSKTMAC